MLESAPHHWPHEAHSGILVDELSVMGLAGPGSRLSQDIRMHRSRLLSLLLLIAPRIITAQAAPTWRVHDMTRPHPAPARAVPAAAADAPPRGAVVLFDGTGLSHWVGADSGPARWTLGKGYFEVRPGTGTLTTVDSFGDMQLHIEWAAPLPARGAGQDRGNSGVFLMGRYELQVLDSWHNDTYTDGQAGAMYGQHPPLFNASLPPGQWQRYDVFFRRPRFDTAGKLLAPARVTVLYNGVPVQNNVELFGPTSWLARLPYTAHPDRLPIALQDHSFPVRYRNIWVRPLPEPDTPPPPAPAVREVPDTVLQARVGSYTDGGGKATVTAGEGRLWLDMGSGPMAMSATSESSFSIDGVDAEVRFPLDSAGMVTGLTLVVGGVAYPYTRER